MSCYHPLVAYWYKPEFLASRPGGLSRPVFISEYEGTKYDYSVSLRVPFLARSCLQQYLIPCGKCIGCRLDNCRQWTFRGLCELDEHSISAFITLTVDDEHMSIVFPNGRLQYRPFQLWLKRLRKMIAPLQIRYMMCGEYGTHTCRPHYHCIVFGWFPPDYVYFGSPTGKYNVYISDSLKSLWPYGFHTVSVANEQTIKYLVGYVLKKVDCDYPRDAPPFLHVSTRPALGLSFFQKYYHEIYSHDGDLQFPNNFVYCGDVRQRVPRYFDKKFNELHNVDYVSLLKYRASLLSSKTPLEKCDLQREEDWLKSVTKASHSQRVNEV